MAALFAVAAIIGYFFPVAILRVQLMGNFSHTMPINIESVFNLIGNLTQERNFPLGDLPLGEWVNLDGIVSSFAPYLIGSLLIYIVVLIGILIVLALNLLGRPTKSLIVFPIILLLLQGILGFLLYQLPITIVQMLENHLGMLAMFLAPAEVFQLSIGIGYWAVVLGLVGMALSGIFSLREKV